MTIETRVWARLKAVGAQTVREIAQGIGVRGTVVRSALERLASKRAVERDGWSVRSRYLAVGDSPPTYLERREANLTPEGRRKGSLASAVAAKLRKEDRERTLTDRSVIHPRPIQSHALDQAMGWLPLPRFQRLDEK